MIAGDRGLARRFSRAAADYDRLTEVQRRIAARLALRLEPLPHQERILEIGCGTGHFTRLLCRRFPAARFWAIDIAAAMIRRAREALPGRGISWIVSDARQDLPATTFDLIASSSSLHWMLPLDRLFLRLHRHLAPSGHLIFALTCDGSFRELRESRRRVAPRKEPRGRLPARTEVLDDLTAAGFRIELAEEQTIVQRAVDAAAFLNALHRQGVTGGVFSQGNALLTRGEIRALIADYNARFPHPDGGVRATYEILYVQARASGHKAHNESGVP